MDIIYNNPIFFQKFNPFDLKLYNNPINAISKKIKNKKIPLYYNLQFKALNHLENMSLIMCLI